ncbi:MAG: hypothetical protein IPL31_04610 [Saprospiraceae bacterium]|nr:hypothetical protein [Saprospiraceae bacterium]
MINVVSVPTAEFDSDTIGGCALGIIKFLINPPEMLKTGNGNLSVVCQVFQRRKSGCKV